MKHTLTFSVDKQDRLNWEVRQVQIYLMGYPLR